MSKPVRTRPLRKVVFHVVGGDESYCKWLVEHGNVCTNFPSTADVILFTGGEDVTPQLYGELPITATMSSIDRDWEECGVFERFKDKPKVGICRGAQFLNVMNGGRLWQDVNNHACGKHIAYDNETEQTFMVTSTHHQMMRPAPGSHVLCVAALSTHKENDKEVIQSPNPDQDIEAVWYEDGKSLCFQPHPEYGLSSCDDLFWMYFYMYVYPLVFSKELGVETH